MKKSNLTAKIGLAACLLAVPVLNASTTINMRGCLARSAKAHEYTATDNSGKTFGLIAEPGVNMHKHVGQEVMITGNVTKSKRTRRVAADEYLRVNQIKEVSASCQ